MRARRGRGRRAEAELRSCRRFSALFLGGSLSADVLSGGGGGFFGPLVITRTPFRRTVFRAILRRIAFREALRRTAFRPAFRATLRRTALRAAFRATLRRTALRADFRALLRRTAMPSPTILSWLPGMLLWVLLCPRMQMALLVVAADLLVPVK